MAPATGNRPGTGPGRKRLATDGAYASGASSALRAFDWASNSSRVIFTELPSRSKTSTFSSSARRAGVTGSGMRPSVASLSAGSELKEIAGRENF